MKGTLRVIQTKNGIKSRIDYTLEKTGKKQSALLGDSDYDLSLNGKECEFELDEKGDLKSMRIEGEAAAVKLMIRHNTDPRRFGHTRVRENREAAAPYNFVPFPDPADIVEVDDPPDFSCYHPNRYTGKIFVNLAPKTPIFIRDTNQPTSFFSVVNGQPLIPGSSIRGLVRTMVEIVSWSRPLAVNDIKLYYRTLADQCKRAKEMYQNMMLQQVKGGLLKKKGRTYEIHPCKPVGGNTIFRVFKDKTRSLFGNRKGVFPIYFDAGSGIITDRMQKKPDKGLTKGFLIVSGDGPPRSKKKDWIISAEPDAGATPIPVSDRDVRSYLEDKNRKTAFPSALLEKPAGAPDAQPEPCFYIQDGTNLYFGYTGNFRLPYNRTLSEIAGLEKPPADFARNLFGFVDDENMQRAGRVYFEDGGVTADADFRVMEQYTQILGSPKPTTFQHYLSQSSDDKNRLTHYNDNNARLRGFKFYWHRQKQTPPDPQAPANVRTDFKPIEFKRGGFESVIRFINLTSAEVGALLFVLNLPEGLLHHIGMAKPLGFGSVQTSATVSVIDPGVRYGSFTAGLLDNTGFQDKDTGYFISEFEKWIIAKLQKKSPELNLTTLWGHDRMNELAAMLQAPPADDAEWDVRRRYLTIRGHRNNEYRDRKVLPVASLVDE